METGIQPVNSYKEQEVVAGIKVITQEYRVMKPIFDEVVVQRPTFVDKQIEIPVGLDKVLVELADQITAKVLKLVDEKLEKAITARIKEVELPKITYKEEIKTIQVDKVNYKDVTLDRPILKDREVINPILVDRNVTNPVFVDVDVDRPVFKDRVVPLPIFEEVIIQKPKYVEKEVTVISLKYVDPKGNPE